MYTIILDSIKLAIKTLKERKTRSTLTIIGITIGPMIIVMMGSVVSGYSNYIVNQISTLGQNTVIIYPESGYTLTQDDLNYIKNLEYIEDAEPFYATQGIIKRGGSEIQVYIYAIKTELILKAIGGLEILNGKNPSEGSTIEALIGYKIAYDQNGENHYNIGDAITITIREIQGGKIAKIKNINVIVSGVLSEYGGALLLSPDQTIILNTEAGRKLLGLKNWSGIMITLKNSEYIGEFTSTMRETYNGKISIIAFGAIANIATSITRAINFINFSTSISTLAVAIAGIMATMITSVIERTREIGVMKAVGFTNQQVIILILMEALTMSIIGGTIGITLGIIGAYTLSSQGLRITSGTTTIIITAQPEITPQLITSTIILTLLVGLIGGALPSYMAAKIPPATALRYE
ncbi:MAG: FtsX-like permease family protein [Candidatus Methanomethylicia archaeon]